MKESYCKTKFEHKVGSLLR